MIRLGLRFITIGGKEAAVRLVATALAVALGVALLLITLAGINAVDAQNARYAWLTTGDQTASSAGSDADPLWWLLEADVFDGETIARVDVAATGPASPVPPGIPELPGPGEYYASPELSQLLAATPGAQLGDRYPGEQVGTIGDAALPAPDSLVIVVGRTADEMADMARATQVDAISTTSPSSCDSCVGIGINGEGINVILAVTAGALMVPVVIFIGTATRLSTARREQRFAAMRLVGATPRQISVISAVESTAIAAAGVVGAFGLFLLLRKPLADIPFTGARFFADDLSLGLADGLLVVAGVPLVAAIAARIALRRVQVTPLGVTRRAAPSNPGAWRLLPLVAGIGELAVVVAVGRPDTSTAQIAAYAPGFLLTMVGLLLAGPWLTLVGSRLLVRRTSQPARLIAGRRLADNPKAGFRAISGLVLALFVTSVAVGAISTEVANNRKPDGGEAFDGVLTAQTTHPGDTLAPLSAALRDQLGKIDGVEGVSTIHTNPLGTTLELGDRELEAGLVSCAEIAQTPSQGRCAAGAVVAEVPPFVIGPWNAKEMAGRGWPAADISADELDALPIQVVAVATDGSTSAIEEARTLLAGAYPDVRTPSTLVEIGANAARSLEAWQQLATVVMLASLVIAGCSLAVSVVAGLIDRKRAFSLLRLTGVPLGVLRRVVALESAVPLLLVALVSTATGFLAAHLFARVQLGSSLAWPGPEFAVLALGGLVFSLAVIASTLPLLDRITGPDTARNE